MPDGSVSFQFDVKILPGQEKDGVYCVRGGICWPVYNELNDTSLGYAIMAAQKVDTSGAGGVVVIFEDTAFRCIDNILDEHGKVEHLGLGVWLNACWAKYHCSIYCRAGTDDTHKRYLRQILESEAIRPEPHFMEVKLSHIEDGINILYFWRAIEKLVMDPESRIISDVELWESNGRQTNNIPASMYALLVLVNGYQQFKYQKTED
jgi:hypothetical protein